jgi:hypothetical protein
MIRLGYGRLGRVADAPLVPSSNAACGQVDRLCGDGARHAIGPRTAIDDKPRPTTRKGV